MELYKGRPGDVTGRQEREIRVYDFLDKLEDMVNFLIPNYIIEGKNQLVISVGCTGG